jgi:tetratricopeptide (TPR) repeat protein
MRASKFSRWLVGLSFGAASLLILPSTVSAAPPGFADTVIELGEAGRRVDEVEQAVATAERIAAKPYEKTAEELAKRLVAGQLMLVERDTERSAVVFLDLLENHPGTSASSQAMHFLGRSLALLGMKKWAKESFFANLADGTPDGKRYHQESLAGLLDLGAPRREAGYARRPGLSATPELRGRLRAIGVSVKQTPPDGNVTEEEQAQVIAAVEAIAAKDRKPLLRYAYGRHLYLKGKFNEARAELDDLAPPDGDPPTSKRQRVWHVRGAYIAAAATLSLKEEDAAIERFERLASLRTSDSDLGQIVDLSWLAQARIHHDRFETEKSVRAYRRISRDSPYFPEAMYETAWTLLRASNFRRAVDALDLLLQYDPSSPLVPELKSLRGKVKIRQRDWGGAEEEFKQLRREFADLSRRVGQDAETWSDAQRYFSAVVAEDMEHFTLASVMPVSAVPIGKTLPRAVQGVEVARLTGDLEHQLTDTRGLLRRMEEAVRASERARLFNDLGAQLASLDNSAMELVEIKEALILRGRVKLQGKGIQDLENKRRQLKKRVDEPLGKGNNRGTLDQKLRKLQTEAHKYDLMITALRAQLVASERYYDATREKQRVDPKGFLNQAADLRESIGVMEKEVRAIREKISRTQTIMRFNDPWQQAHREVLASYSSFLDGMNDSIVKVNSEADSNGVWNKITALESRVAAGRESLDASALRRLERAMGVLVEERAKLDGYRVEMDGYIGKTRALVGEVMQASLQDVSGELKNFTMRSEVGLLDVAWAVQEEEAMEIQRLETIRDRDLRELDRALDQGLEDLGK